MAPPVVLVFFSWSGTCAQQVQRRALVGVQGAKPLQPPKNLHPTVPKAGFKIDQKHLDGYTFFSALEYEVTATFQKVQNFEFQISSFLSETIYIYFVFLARQYVTSFKI